MVLKSINPVPHQALFFFCFFMEFNSRRRRLFLRAALFLWITPLAAALSNSRMAKRMAASSPLSWICSLALETADRARLRMMRFRTRFFSLLRMRLIADFKFAKISSWEKNGDILYRFQ